MVNIPATLVLGDYLSVKQIGRIVCIEWALNRDNAVRNELPTGRTTIATGIPVPYPYDVPFGTELTFGNLYNAGSTGLPMLDTTFIINNEGQLSCYNEHGSPISSAYCGGRIYYVRY